MSKGAKAMKFGKKKQLAPEPPDPTTAPGFIPFPLAPAKPPKPIITHTNGYDEDGSIETITVTVGNLTFAIDRKGASVSGGKVTITPGDNVYSYSPAGVYYSEISRSLPRTMGIRITPA